MFRRPVMISALLALLLTLIGAWTVSAQDATATPAPTATPFVAQVGPITKAIMDRGSVICGVNATLQGFGFQDANGNFSGFDIDFCRAVAAAILGDATKVTYKALTAAQRPTAIASGEIDMMARNTTFTISRDVQWGVTFAPTTFYDGQGVMVTADSGITDLAGLEGGTICTDAGTTTELNITDAMKKAGVKFTLQTFPSFDPAMDAFQAGRCDAVTTDISGLVSKKASAPDPGKFTILDVVLSKEPLGPLSPSSDEQFADVLRWVVYGTIQAEEFGITSKNIDTFLTSEDPNILRFLGQGDNASGSLLGIPNDFMVAVIKQVGNYGEIFDRNLGPDTIFKLPRGKNDLWTNGGLLYAPPFR